MALLRELRRDSSSEEKRERLPIGSSSSLNYYINLAFISKTLNFSSKSILTSLIYSCLFQNNSFCDYLNNQQYLMQSSPFYISKEFIAQIPGQQVLENYNPVDIHLQNMKIVDMSLELTTHRLLFKSTTQHALLIKGETITNVSILEEGFFSKDYFVKLNTQYGQAKLSLKSYNQAKISIDNMVKKKAWNQKPTEQKKESNFYSGMFEKIHKEKQKITTQGQQVSQSFSSFDSLFGNLRDIKKIMNEMRSATGHSDGENPEVNKILKDMGFVSVIEKDQAGKDFYRQLAKDLFNVCEQTLFKSFGGVVALLDLFYFYNKKRQFNLLSPEEMLKACEMFPKLGYNAKVQRYPNNIILIESTTFDANSDFEKNYAKYFQDFHTGMTADEIARRKGLPVAIVEIKLRQACKNGRLAVADRIQGIKYYKNMLLTI